MAKVCPACAARRTGRHPSYCTFLDRFWNKVEKGKPDACWNWIGAKHPFGYGDIRLGGGSRQRTIHIRAHRFSYELHHGPIPAGLDVCHSCDNPTCVNPHHLFVGTARDNVLDAIRNNRMPQIRKANG